jgi:FkbM family methyltransferase
MRGIIKLLPNIFSLFYNKNMRFSFIIKNIFRSLGIESYFFRPWMATNTLLKFYKIKTVIDVGANTGQFAMEVLKANNKLKIHSFEPIHHVFEALQKNTSAYSNIQCYKYGVGEKEGTTEINVNEASPSSSILELADTHKRNYDFALSTTKETISITTLDAFMNKNRLERPILLKIDVQGYEDRVLRGAKEALKQVDILHIESSFQEMYKGQMLFGDLFNFARKEGFEFVGLVDNTHDKDNHELLFCNAIFRKKQ